MNSASAISSLRHRISQMQSLELDERALPTAAALRPLLPGGTLRGGASYSVVGSQQLALSLLAAASASGAWCGVVGDDAFGAEAAADLGIALDRCVFVPNPGQHAVGIAGSLAEVLTIVVLMLPSSSHTRVPPGEAERIAARLREHGSALVVLGDWPRTESALRVTASRWSGLGHGSGILTSRELSVESHDRRGIHRHTIRFSDGALAEPAQATVHRLVPR